MKTAAKIFIWIGMIWFSLLVFPVVVGVMALNKIENAKSKDELKTIAILTIIFCSVLGGIFMLNFEQKDFEQDSFKRDFDCIFYKKKRKMTKSRIFSITYNAIIIFMSILTVDTLVIAFYAICNIEGLTYIPAILAGIQIIIYVVMLYFYIERKTKNPKLFMYSVISFAVLSLVTMVMSIITNCCNFVFCYHDYYENFKVYNYFTEYWLIFGGAFANLICSLFVVLFYNRLNNYDKSEFNKLDDNSTLNSTNVIITSKLEIELNYAKDLREKNLISEEEYKMIRENILKKYY